jgi:hypothetical protein
MKFEFFKAKHTHKESSEEEKLSRREFLRKTAAVVAGIAVAEYAADAEAAGPSSSWERKSYPEIKKKIDAEVLIVDLRFVW